MADESPNYDAEVAKELERIKAYREALTQEFADADVNDPDNPDKARKQVFELVPDAGTTIRWLIIHANSESVRASLSKWVFEVVMKVADKNSDDDELTKLVRQLQDASN